VSTPIYLFDISAYLHRAMYVCYGDRCEDIEPSDTTFIRHAAGMLANTMQDLRVERMAVVCDSTEPSLRCDVFPEYKAERKAHYPVFATQAPRFYDALRDVSVAVMIAPRYEADDLIATMAGYPGERYVVVSSDKDLLALVRDDRSVDFYDPMKAAWISAGDVRNKFGVDPGQLYDYIGLVGDTSDGIPGVPGFGPKTAAKLLREFDSLDEIYSLERREALSEFATQGQVKKLLAHQDDAFMSRKLASPWLPPKFTYKSAHFDAPAPGIIRKACG
jgi:DNA polymerase-1